MKKRKKKIYPITMEDWGITVKSISNLDENSTQFELVILKKDNEIKGFNPNKLNMIQMTSVGYSVSFSNTF
jgi:hypothetical protein